MHSKALTVSLIRNAVYLLGSLRLAFFLNHIAYVPFFLR